MNMKSSGSPISKNNPAYYHAVYNSARSNLLTMLLFSLINLIFLVVEANTYFLFSSAFSYKIVCLGQLYSYYLQTSSFFVMSLILAVVWLLLFFLCWIFSKKRHGWLIFATLLFALDCIFLALSYTIFIFDPSQLLDILFHIAVMVYLIRGIWAHKKLTHFPATPTYDPSLITNRVPLYPLSPADEARILIQGVYNGIGLLLRRTQDTIEFAANGMVYATLLPGQTTCDILVGDVSVHFATENGVYSLSVQGQVIAQAAAVESPVSPM